MENGVSVIIPARNEVYLKETIENVLQNAREDIELIVVLDGYIPSPPIKIKDERLIFIQNKTAIGQRQAINQAARQAKGKYMMKLDAHCAVDVGFDVKLKADCEYDWTVIPRMYNLDVKTWKPKLFENTALAIKKRKLHDYMYIGWNNKNEMRTLYYGTKDNSKWHRKTELIDDTMSCMGCCFFMYLDRFWDLGGCDEGHGGWGQQGIEVSLKAHLSGGCLKVNKKTWFAHWFRASDGGFPYSISGNAVSRARDYSMDLWLNNKWEHQTRKIQWMLDKYNPPSWEGRLGLPEGKWYQEATIKGIAMPTQRTNDTSAKRWNQFIYPLINPGKGTFVDLGCNAGFYTRKMVNLGYTAIGVEKDDLYFGHAEYWEKNEPKGIKLIHSNITDYTVPEAEIVLLANVHYWLTKTELNKLVKQLRAKVKQVIIIGRHSYADVHKSKPDLVTLKKTFKDWNITKTVGSKKHYSVLFTNKEI